MREAIRNLPVLLEVAALLGDEDLALAAVDRLHDGRRVRVE